jgi:hypothetical protein
MGRSSRGLKAYLREGGVLDKGPEAIAQAKEQYWKAYRHELYVKRKETHPRLNLCLKRTIFKQLAQVASARRVSVNDLVREAISLRLGHPARMDEGTKELLRVLSGMESHLNTYLRNNGQVPIYLPSILLSLRDIQAHIHSVYDLQRQAPQDR